MQSYRYTGMTQSCLMQLFAFSKNYLIALACYSEFILSAIVLPELLLPLGISPFD